MAAPSRFRMMPTLFVVLCCLTSLGCLTAAAALRAGAGVGLRAGATSAAGMGLRAGAVAGGLRAATAARAAVPLQATLRALSRTPARVALTPSGMITRAGTRVAQITPEGIIRNPATGASIGRVVRGQLWEIDEFGNSVRAVGELKGALRGRGGVLRSSRDGAIVRRLNHDELLEVVEVNANWYQVRLADGTYGWVWAPALALASVFALTSGGDDEDDDRQRGPYLVALSDGRTLAARAIDHSEAVMIVTTEDGRDIAVDKDLISSMRRSAPMHTHGVAYRIHLESGLTLVASDVNDDGVITTVKLSGEERLVVDSDLVDRIEPIEPQDPPREGRQ